MKNQPGSPKAQYTAPASEFDSLLSAIRDAGFRLIGPHLRDGAVMYDPIGRSSDLPIGWVDEQNGGTYRLHRKRNEQPIFGYVVGPQSWKSYLHPPTVTVWMHQRQNDADPSARATEGETAPLAFVGVRPCELAAIAIQDRVFLHGEHVDPGYKARRENLFVVAVNCATPAGTCFCASMGTGPKATTGYDIALTEVCRNGDHYFVLDCGTERGAAVLNSVSPRGASADELAAANEITVTAARKMRRSLETRGLAEILRDEPDSPRWNEVAKRCLNCANCTMVCPTCFCTNIEDTTDLSGDTATRRRVWDSCFTLGFTYIHGGTIRSSALSRYRQWLTHKLSSWHDQFGTSGCVGCGRCITWCPVGIDITEEARAIRAQASPRPEPVEV